MKVKFKNGYMGRETRECWVEPDVIVEIDDSERHLIDNGLAVLVEKETIEQSADPVIKPRRTRKVRDNGIKKDAD